MANEKFKVKFGLAAGDTAATIDGTTGDISTNGDIDVKGGNIQNSTGALEIASTGATNVVINPGSGSTINDGHMILGELNTGAILTTNGTGSLDLRTGTYPTTANINLASGVNGNITVDTDGTGQVVINADVDINGTIYLDQLQVDNININGNTISSTDTNGNITLTPNGSGTVIVSSTLDVQGGTITDSTGALTITSGATNTNLTLDPNGTGNVVLTLANGGNLTNDRNYVFGAIRNSTTASAGDIHTLGPAGTGFRGVSLDNNADTTKGPSQVLRSYSGGAVSGSTSRGRVVFDKARGTSVSPTAVQQGDLIGSVDATGYTSTGWVNDLVATPIGTGLFAASENWVSNTNLGTQYQVFLAPTATTISSSANLLPVMSASPQSLSFRSDAFGISKAKTNAFVATGSSISGTTLTIGTVISGTVAVGQVVAGANVTVFGAYIVSNISGSGSGSTWTISQSTTAASGTIVGLLGYVGSNGTTLDALADLRLLKNNIQSSDGTTAITLSGADVAVANKLSTSGSTFDNTLAVDAQTNLLDTNTTSGTSLAIQTNYWTSSAKTTRTVPQSGNKLGNFRWNSYSDTAGTFVLGSQVSVEATENWTSTANGSKIQFFANKQGQSWTPSGQVQVASFQPESSSFSSDVFTIENSAGTDYAVFNSSGLTLAGDLRVNGNDIQDSTGANVLLFNQESNNTTYQRGTAIKYFDINTNSQSNMAFVPGDSQGATAGDRITQFSLFHARTSPTDTALSSYFTWPYDHSTGNFSPIGADETLGEIGFGGQYGTGSSSQSNGVSSFIRGSSAEAYTAGANGGRITIGVDKIGGTTAYDAIKIDSANASIASDIITLENNTGTDYAVFNSTSATFTQPVGFPVKTAAQWNAITGAVGRQVCVSDSAGGAHPNGMMAFWDTSNARWSYIHDNSAV